MVQCCGLRRLEMKMMMMMLMRYTVSSFRPFSLGVHFVSGDISFVYVWLASFSLKARRAWTKLFKSPETKWLPCDKGLFPSEHTIHRLNEFKKMIFVSIFRSSLCFLIILQKSYNVCHGHALFWAKAGLKPWSSFFIAGLLSSVSRHSK